MVLLPPKSTLFRILLALICVEDPVKGWSGLWISIFVPRCRPWTWRWTVVGGQGGAPAAQRGRTTLMSTRSTACCSAGRRGWLVFKSCAASGGVRCCWWGACRRPDLSGSADEVRRHDEDGVPDARAGEGAAAQSFRDVQPRVGGDSAS